MENLLKTITNYIIYVNNTSEMPILIIISIVVLILFIINFFKRSFLLFSLLVLPGTAMHEIAHYLFSLILLGNPGKISIFPKKEDNGYTLGYVESSNITYFNVIPIALAPLTLLPFSFFLFNNYAIYEKDIFSLSIELFFISNLIYGSIPSTTDIGLIFSKFKWFLIIGIFLFIYFIYLSNR